MLFDMNKYILRKLKELESTEVWKEEEIEDIIIESIDLNKIKHTIINSILYDCYGLIRRSKMVEIKVDISNIKSILSRYIGVNIDSIPDKLVFDMFTEENIKKALGKYEIKMEKLNVFRNTDPNNNLPYSDENAFVITINIECIIDTLF